MAVRFNRNRTAISSLSEVDSNRIVLQLCKNRFFYITLTEKGNKCDPYTFVHNANFATYI
jgi:hypothetical protein